MGETNFTPLYFNMMIKAKKYLGQHFLKDENIALSIVESLQLNSDNILEIGPGTGVLSKYLLKIVPEKLQFVEIDTESIDYLNNHYPLARGKIIHGDFLKLDLSKHFKGSISIVGNLPYYISSQIFFKFIEHRDQVVHAVAMVQKEVGARLAAPAGNKNTGILSVYLQCFFDIEYLFTVNEDVFHPPPKVKSAVIRIKRNQREELPCNEKQFLRIVKTAFGQRRKTIRNSLRSIFIDLNTDKEIFSKRPEQLSIDEFIQLTLWAFEENKE